MSTTVALESGPIVVTGAYICYVCRQILPGKAYNREIHWVEKGNKLYQSSLCRSEHGDPMHTEDEMLNGAATILQKRDGPPPDIITRGADKIWQDLDDYSDPDQTTFAETSREIQESYLKLMRDILKTIRL
jgi:hypothetical protein